MARESLSEVGTSKQSHISWVPLEATCSPGGWLLDTDTIHVEHRPLSLPEALSGHRSTLCLTQGVPASQCHQEGGQQVMIETPASSRLVRLWGQVIYPGDPWAPGICSLTHLWITCDCRASPPLPAPTHCL